MSNLPPPNTNTNYPINNVDAVDISVKLTTLFNAYNSTLNNWYNFMTRVGGSGQGLDFNNIAIRGVIAENIFEKTKREIPSTQSQQIREFNLSNDIQSGIYLTSTPTLSSWIDYYSMTLTNPKPNCFHELDWEETVGAIFQNACAIFDGCDVEIQVFVDNNPSSVNAITRAPQLVTNTRQKVFKGTHISDNSNFYYNQKHKKIKFDGGAGANCYVYFSFRININFDPQKISALKVGFGDTIYYRTVGGMYP